MVLCSVLEDIEIVLDGHNEMASKWRAMINCARQQKTAALETEK